MKCGVVAVSEEIILMQRGSNWTDRSEKQDFCLLYGSIHSMYAHHPHCLGLIFCIYLTALLFLLQTHTHPHTLAECLVLARALLSGVYVWSRPVDALFISMEKAIWVVARQSASGCVCLW